MDETAAHSSGDSFRSKSAPPVVKKFAFDSKYDSEISCFDLVDGAADSVDTQLKTEDGKRLMDPHFMNFPLPLKKRGSPVREARSANNQSPSFNFLQQENYSIKAPPTGTPHSVGESDGSAETSEIRLLKLRSKKVALLKEVQSIDREIAILETALVDNWQDGLLESI